MAGTGLAIILVGLAALVFFHAEGDVAGLPADQFASLVALGALVLMISSWVVQEFRGHWMRGLQAVLFWTVLAIGLVGLYSYRGELHEVASRLIGEIAPGEPVVGSGGEVSVTRRMGGTFVVGSGGEVSVTRRMGGTFVVAGRANDRDLRFIFDTGASTVVLTTEGAKTIGFDPAALNYVVPVSTANGRTLAAPVTLETLTVGSITERRVRALVARPGVLGENLLGMTFLERLASYEVRGNRLILRGRGA